MAKSSGGGQRQPDLGDTQRTIRLPVTRHWWRRLFAFVGHGHKRLADLIHGDTIQSVRHGLAIPILAVRGEAGKTGSTESEPRP